MPVHYVNSFLQSSAMMNLLVFILLLYLDFRVVFGFNFPDFVEQYSKDDRVEVYGVLEAQKCPKIIQPLCGTNGKEFVYFENKCHFEAKNYEQLISGLMEYYECPLSLCGSACPICRRVNKPVCAVQLLSGVKKVFPNPCEVNRRICTTKQEWQIVNLFECNSHYNNRILTSSKVSWHKYDCPKLCTLEYQPVCARFMNLEKEFVNKCELKTTICQTKQKWQIIRQGPCQSSSYNTVTDFYAIDNECPRPCAFEYSPLCAKLQNKLKVFNNKCELENIRCQGHEWQIIKEGSCWQSPNKPEGKKCPEFCSSEYRPVCAVYKGQQREFRNSCQMLRVICESNLVWKIIKNGTCLSCENEALAPICATYDFKTKTFNNLCQLAQEIKRTRNNWSILHKGICSNTTPTTSSSPATTLEKPTTTATNNTTAATTSITLKSSALQTTTTTSVQPTTSYRTTNNPKATTTEFKTSVALETTTNATSEFTEEIYKTTRNSFNYEKELDDETYPVKDSGQVTISHGYENKLCVNNSSEESDSHEAADSEENSIESYENYSQHDVGSERASKKRNKYYGNANYSRYNKSSEKLKKSKENEKYPKVALNNAKEKLYSFYQAEQKTELNVSGITNEKDRLENLENHKKIIPNAQNSGDTDFQASKYLVEKSLTKWIKLQVQKLLSKMGSQTYLENGSEEQLLVRNKSQSEKTGFEEYQMFHPKSQQMAANINLTITNDRKDNGTKCNNTHESVSVNQTQLTAKYRKRNESKITDNIKNNLKIYEISWNKSNDDKPKSPIGSTAKVKLTNLENQSTVSYPTTEKIAVNIEQQDHSKYHLQKSKKDEIYNGIVYKAPVYDAPTYNFIYTAPFNFHGLGSHHNIKNSLVNQTNSTVAGNVPFPAYHIPPLLPAATSAIFRKPNDSTYKHLPLPFKSVYSNIQPQTLPSPFPSPAHDNFLTSLVSFNNNLAAKKPNPLSLNPNEENNKNRQRKDDRNKVLPSVTSHALHYNTAAHYNPSIPQHLQKSSSDPVLFSNANSPHISLNTTLLQQIVEILKIITKRYN